MGHEAASFGPNLELIPSLVNFVRVKEYQMQKAKVDEGCSKRLLSLWKYGGWFFLVACCPSLDRKSITSPSSWLNLSGDLR